MFFLSQPTYAVLPQAGEAQLRIYNGYNCIVNVQTEDGINTIIDSMDVLELKSLKVTDKKNIRATITAYKYNCLNLTTDFVKWSKNLTVTEKKVSQ